MKIAEPCELSTSLSIASRTISSSIGRYLKNAALTGTVVINNPFWWSADDQFFNYALAPSWASAIPNTVVLPHKLHPPGTTVQSMRNLIFPLNWDEVFEYVGFPAFLKPFRGGGWKTSSKSIPMKNSSMPTTRPATCMILQIAVEFEEYYRCYVVGQEQVRVMKYDPTLPHHLRYARRRGASSQALQDRLVKDCLTLCRALGLRVQHRWSLRFRMAFPTPSTSSIPRPTPMSIRSVTRTLSGWWNMSRRPCYREGARTEKTAAQYRWSHFLAGNCYRAAGK